MNYKIFIINLDRSVERYTHALAQLSAWPELPVERISAADGRQMSEAELNQYYAEDLNRKHFHKLLKAGEKGCYISHIRCWQQIVAQQLDFAIILEDDFILQADLPQLIASIQALTTPYHYLKLAMPNKQQPVLTRQSMLNGFSLVDYKKMPVSTVAQVVSQQGAALLLEKAVPFYRPIDVQLQYSFELGIRAQGIQPQAVRPELEFESNIYSKHTDVVDRGLFYRNRVHFAWANFRHNVAQYGLSVTLNAST